ncbi:hypothetical protein AAIB33_14495 [Microbacterium sp. AZCO]|uniref:hypothetical protein n=1 Tax=Microbacterium sp. AZCO TaxID=3142976 RepID=UPI0031F3D3E0
MDDTTRAELAELRRRAYGPHPDIAGDPVALARLSDLERLAHDPHPDDGGRKDGLRWADRSADDSPPGDAGRKDGMDAAPVAVATLEQRPADDQEPEAPVRRRRVRGGRGAGIAFAAAVVAGLVVVSTTTTVPTLTSANVTVETTRSAYTLARDQDAQVLIQVPLHDWFGSEGEPPLPADAPPFPTAGKVLWASHLGSYYGWQLWIGGAKGMLQEEQCILVSRGDIAKGRCVVAPLRSQSALAVTLPYLSVPPDDRPSALQPGMRLGFWWFHDSAVTVMLAAAPRDG